MGQHKAPVYQPELLFYLKLYELRQVLIIFAVVGSFSKAARHRWYEALPCA
jgi:hypothetical protein